MASDTDTIIHNDKEFLVPTVVVNAAQTKNLRLGERNPSFSDSQNQNCTKTENVWKIQSLVSSIASSVLKLRKSLGIIQGFSLMVGIMIGSGIFISPSLVIMEIKDVGMALIIWLASGLIALLGSLCYCELGSVVKRAGGNYSYILFFYGPLPAFLCAWNQALLVDPMAISAVTLTLASYTLKPFEEVLEDNPWYAKAIAAFCIIVIATINCFSVEAATLCQALFTLSQMLSILFIVILGIWQMIVGDMSNFQDIFKNLTFDFSSLGSYGAAFYGALWAYNGWQKVGNIVEDMKNVQRNLFLTIITSVPFVILSYLAINVAFFTVLTPVQLESPAVAVDFVNELFGVKVGYIMPVMVSLSCFGCANGCVFAAGRVSLAAGREGHFPEVLGMIHRERHTTIPAILLTSSVAIVMLIPDSSNLRTLINFATVCSWVNCGSAVFGLIVLRIYRPDIQRPFKVWIIAPIIISLLSFMLIITPFIKNPMNSAIAIGLILLGIPVYIIFIYLSPKHPIWFTRILKGLTKQIKTNLNLVPCGS